MLEIFNLIILFIVLIMFIFCLSYIIFDNIADFKKPISIKILQEEKIESICIVKKITRKTIDYTFKSAILEIKCQNTSLSFDSFERDFDLFENEKEFVETFRHYKEIIFVKTNGEEVYKRYKIEKKFLFANHFDVQDVFFVNEENFEIAKENKCKGKYTRYCSDCNI